MAVHAVELRISQCLERVDMMNWDQVMDHFLMVCMIFMLFHEVYIYGMLWP